jgi:hypothetical protein
VVLHSPSRTSSAAPTAPRNPTRDRRISLLCLLPWGCPPLRRARSGGSVSRRGPTATPIKTVVAAATSRIAPCRPHLASSRDSTPAPFRLRRFSRPWRVDPPRTLWPVSTTHAHGVRFPVPRRGGGWGSRLQVSRLSTFRESPLCAVMSRRNDSPPYTSVQRFMAATAPVAEASGPVPDPWSVSLAASASGLPKYPFARSRRPPFRPEGQSGQARQWSKLR